MLDSEADHEMLGDGGNPADIDDLIEELEDLSDSEPELDTMSVMSTPKPRLRYRLKYHLDHLLILSVSVIYHY